MHGNTLGWIPEHQGARRLCGSALSVHCLHCSVFARSRGAAHAEGAGGQRATQASGPTVVPTPHPLCPAHPVSTWFSLHPAPGSPLTPRISQYLWMPTCLRNTTLKLETHPRLASDFPSK